jgi:beta-glucosidase-like glycosyl hydrolase
LAGGSWQDLTMSRPSPIRRIASHRLVMPALRWPIESEEPFLRLAEAGIGGFCVFGGDESLIGFIARLQNAAPHPLLIAADYEEGVGQHVQGFSVHPTAAALDPDAAEIAGIRTAVEARRLGINMTFAPVCDVLSERTNPIIQSRAFLDPMACVPRYIEGARRFGLRTCAKHFPGHGATSTDSHDALPVVAAAAHVWRERDLPPFAVAIAAGVDAVMTAHIDCPALTGEAGLPATLSKRVMTGLLRDEMGFQGLLVTDALLMEGVRSGRGEGEAARLSLQAGCDVLLCPGDLDAVLAAAGDAGDVDAALARVSAASEPLPDPMDLAAARSVTGNGAKDPIGSGEHPLRIFARGTAGRRLAKLLGRAYELHDFHGRHLDSGAGVGLDRPSVAILRPERAWGGPLELSEAVRKAANEASALWLFGAEALADGLSPSWLLRAPGTDDRTLQAAVHAAFEMPG